MDLTVWMLFSGSVMAIAAGLVWSHLHTWKLAQQSDLEPRELGFMARQFRRRMQTSSMLFLLGMAILIGNWVPRERPNLYVLYWSGIFLWTLWIMLLAFGDALLSRLYLRAETRQRQIDQAKARAELHRQTLSKRNGKSESPPGSQ